jgi:hypothetical protein
MKQQLLQVLAKLFPKLKLLQVDPIHRQALAAASAKTNTTRPTQEDHPDHNSICKS